MSQKNKKSSIQDNIQDIAKNAGLVAMTGAMALGLVEVSGQYTKPAVATTSETSPAGDQQSHNETVRRSEEVGPHYISYGNMNRTAARSGR